MSKMNRNKELVSKFLYSIVEKLKATLDKDGIYDTSVLNGNEQAAYDMLDDEFFTNVTGGGDWIGEGINDDDELYDQNGYDLEELAEQ